MRLQALPLRALAEEVVLDVVPPAGGIVTAVDIDERWLVRADRDEIHRVLTNLVKNAAQATAAGGIVTIRALKGSVPAHSLVIEVIDSGSGIPLELQPHLFEPFATADRGNGTGLGLTICREIMRRHGGDVYLARSDSDGTCFAVHFPTRAIVHKTGMKDTMSDLTKTVVAGLAVCLISGCSIEGPSLANQPGLQTKVMAYYRNHATEEGGTCRSPEMRSVTSDQILDDGPTDLIVRVRYYYEDTFFGDDSLIPRVPRKCTGFAERDFTMAKPTAI